MVSEALIVENVFLDFVFAVFDDFFFQNQIFICFLQFIVHVARVVTASRLSMFIPISETEPTKMVVALSTGHVHATLVFLDVRVTLWARLGVSLYPSQVFRIVDFFFVPNCD